MPGKIRQACPACFIMCDCTASGHYYLQVLLGGVQQVLQLAWLPALVMWAENCICILWLLENSPDTC
jgi:hypothetical protein